MSRVSLKGRILLGAILWTIGLFTISGIVHDILHAPLVRVVHHSIFGLGYRPTMTVVSVLCMFFGFLQTQRGLSPVNQLRHRLAAVHRGVDARVVGLFPAEVQPLVDDLNRLLDERERRVSRAIARAGDLAHGLKTPLAVLAHEAQQARTVRPRASISRPRFYVARKDLPSVGVMLLRSWMTSDPPCRHSTVGPRGPLPRLP